MSDYINETFKRMNLHKIRSFFLHGTDHFVEEVQPYCNKLKQGCDPIYKRLDSIYADETERDKDASNMLIFLQQNQIMDLAGLDEKFAAMLEEQIDIRDKLKPIERCFPVLKKHIELADFKLLAFFLYSALDTFF